MSLAYNGWPEYSWFRERGGRKKGMWFILIVPAWLVIASLARFCLDHDEYVKRSEGA